MTAPPKVTVIYISSFLGPMPRSLDTLILSPPRSDYTIIWSNGICTTYNDYLLLLEPLAEKAKVVAYNYRDQKKRRFNPYKAVEDLDDLIKQQDSPVFLAGHCTGAAISISARSDVQGRILICPYLGKDHLSSIPRWMMQIGKHLPLCYMDRLIQYLGLTDYIGVKNEKPLQDVWAMRNFQPKFSQSQAMWMVSSHDEILGTLFSIKHYARMKSYLKAQYPSGQDKSRLIKGLTHSLNTIPGQLIPALASCPDRRRKRIVDALLTFCKKSTPT